MIFRASAVFLCVAVTGAQAQREPVLKQINEIFPGPGKAPEAYAW